jgi:glutathione S-transferase
VRVVEFVEIDEARERRGLRLVTVGGVPSPWSEAAKGFLQMKRIPFVAVRMPPGENAVTAWTGSASAPVGMFDDEPARSGWTEILLLVERLAPKPRLIPEDPEERALLFGMSHEICGEMGLAWCRRLELIQSGFDSDGARGFPPAIGRYLAPKYGYRPGCASEARGRILDVLRMLGRHLARQAGRGSRYYLGDAVTALDVYSATFLAMFAPLSQEHCPIPDALRRAFEWKDAELDAALDRRLLEHRDFIYTEHLELPLTL